MLVKLLGAELLEMLPGNQMFSQVKAQVTLRNITRLRLLVAEIFGKIQETLHVFEN
jgi:hypothetical protein